MGAYVGAPLPQRMARAGDSHTLIAAQRGEGSDDAVHKVLRGGDAQFALLDLLVKISGVVI